MNFSFESIALWQQIIRAIILVLLLASGLLISILDFKKRIIPNSMVVLWLVLGLTNLLTYIDFEKQNYNGIIFPAICFGVFVVLGLVLFFALGENKIGGGDAKLMMTLGAFMITISHVFLFAIVSFVLAVGIFVYAKVKGIKSIPAGPVYAFSAVVPYAFYSFPWYIGLAVTLAFISIFVISCYTLWKKNMIEPFETVD